MLLVLFILALPVIVIAALVLGARLNRHLENAASRSGRSVERLNDDTWAGPFSQRAADDAVNELVDASIRDLTKPLRRFEADDPRAVERQADVRVTCGACAGARTKACPNALCGPACEVCMGYRRVACGACGGIGIVAMRAG